MRPKVFEYRLEHALALAGLLAALNLWLRPASAGASPPANGMAPPTLNGPDADPGNDPDQAPAIFEQWRSGSTSRGSLDHILENLTQDKENKVERKTVHYPSGGRASKETTVFSKLSGHRLLYASKQTWNLAGRLETSYHQVDTLDESGVQIAGQRRTLDYKEGSLSAEILEEWTPDFKGWLVTYASAISYYEDGSMKERVTSLPPKNRKTKEEWGNAVAAGRMKTVQHWDGKAKRWI